MKNSKKYIVSALICGATCFALPAAFAGSGHDADSKFAAMDTDHDGRISRAEHAAATQQMFNKMDANHDGVVTASEMEESHETKMTGKYQKDEKSAQEKIAEFDANADGKLTRSEYEAGSDALFTKMDTDNDGYLSKAEFEAGHKMLKKEK